MQTESQGSLACEAQHNQENIPIQVGDFGVVSFTSDNIVPAQPAKKPTRQWAAWTRQEEESFFTALRQVGKNFEKITCRVQSKNKDQVRHYYYRLVRRMNKLLGPGLCLDAKNSKDTNAAMLRWWSLLEKYSCRASKLHLKPRRFKIFVEALEHQLVKDRKKNVRKRPSQGENSSPTSPNSVANQSRASGNDAGVNRSNGKGESNTMKSARQRRKPGASSAAYKKWEKAAIAGVSLVADAAEHLERTTNDKDIEQEQDTPVPGHKILDPIENNQFRLPAFSQNPFAESNVHAAGKLKLQLFPIDDSTRRALEMDKHNPHLELTLSIRKKISSVLEHLNRKWGNSTIASGELMLFPYVVQRENLRGYQRWTQASIVSASDVYAMIGSPQVFRLRYGWFSDTEVASLTWQAPVSPPYIPSMHNMNVESRKGCVVEEVQVSVSSTGDQPKKLDDPCKNQPILQNKNNAVESSLTDFPNEMNRCLTTGLKDNLGDSPIPATNTSSDRSETCNVAIMGWLEDADDQRLNNSTAAVSAGEWADSLTNISVGDILAEVPHDLDSNCVDHPVGESLQCLQQIPFSCDSFDAAIAAHISRHQNKMEFPSLASHASSIWDAEETCDVFSFSKNPTPCAISRFSSATSQAACKQIARSKSAASGTLSNLLPLKSPDPEEPMVNSACEELVDECPSDMHIMDTTEKDFNELTDIYWPDSLGPLDLDVPSCKYHSEDLILGDNLGGLNQLIASSLDAFQNCLFFGFDKKESISTVEARDNASSASKFDNEG
ncbi:TSL-kinase interacting protein 1-like isoform X2 [Durio zibethinus]|uniref:TSL-kinase interacting protein 1-like isoform X2 n=1 Tax=Durio zibethinus TaxID=66656 RepID=A0A6P5YPX9_DURZI|nr:TSL-kinase interacting protein 1-like isoform X2 [Durio zibethinus]